MRARVAAFDCVGLRLYLQQAEGTVLSCKFAMEPL